jgi:hypothetical protein
MRIVLLVAVIAAAISRHGLAATADSDDIRSRMAKLPESPRLLLGRGEEARVRDLIASDPQIKAAWELVHSSADLILEQPPVERKLIGRRLLGVSRTCLQRMTHLGIAYRLTGQQKYADRAKAEMLAAASFSDWNPSHFLDVAEMTAALAIGVDWLHDGLDSETRRQIRRAIIEKGLKPSWPDQSWVTGENNWNQVCHGGMVLGALVVAEDEPELASAVVVRAISGLPHAIKAYAPDGAYPEGPGYWTYGTTYNVVTVAALQKALGSDFGLLDLPGFARTAEYYLHVTGPTGLWFNYSDAGQRRVFDPSPAMYYLAAWRNDPALLDNERAALASLVAHPEAVSPKSTDRFLPMLLIWSKPGMTAEKPRSLSFIGRGMTPLAVFRSDWSGDATFAGIKGGQASGPHAHMDAGTFVVDMGGTRFVEDLGAQDYNSIESRGLNLWDRKASGDRWQIFRLSARSHNVLIVDGKDHNVDGRGEIVASTATSAKLDLSSVYLRQLAGAARELGLQPDGVTVIDTVKATPDGAVIRWQIVTSASVVLNGDSAELTRDGKQALLRITGAEGIALHARPTDPPPASYDASNPGRTIVWFDVPLSAGATKTWTAKFALVRTSR